MVHSPDGLRLLFDVGRGVTTTRCCSLQGSFSLLEQAGNTTQHHDVAGKSTDYECEKLAQQKNQFLNLKIDKTLKLLSYFSSKIQATGKLKMGHKGRLKENEGGKAADEADHPDPILHVVSLVGVLMIFTFRNIDKNEDRRV